MEGRKQIKNNTMLLSTYSCEMQHAEWEKVIVRKGERREMGGWMAFSRGQMVAVV